MNLNLLAKGILNYLIVFYGYIGIPGHTLSLSTDNTDKAVFVVDMKQRELSGLLKTES